MHSRCGCQARHPGRHGTGQQIPCSQCPDGGRPKKLAFLAHKYYTDKLGKNELPPDICIEIYLWERFGWSEIDTDHISMRKMREIFTALNQQRYSRDAVENLGKPDTERHERILADEQRIRQEKHNEDR